MAIIGAKRLLILRLKKSSSVCRSGKLAGVADRLTFFFAAVLDQFA
jgi:hypothetical protein